VISRSLPSVENVSSGDDDCVPNIIPPSEPALDAYVPIIEIFPGELESDDEDNDTICVGPGDPLHTPVATHVNTVFDEGDDNLAAEISAIVNH